MKILLSTIKALAKVITGDGGISPYRSGPMLVNLFNEYGGDAEYGSGFPSRWKFTEDQLIRLNDSEFIKKIIEEVVNPTHYIDTEYEVHTVVDYLNKYLVYDKIQLVKEGIVYKLKVYLGQSNSDQSLVDVNFTSTFNRDKLSHVFILEQIDKFQEKVESGDFDGAITNARSMVEGVFEELVIRSGACLQKHDGDLNKLYKQVKKCLNLDNTQPDLSQTLIQMLSGLNSIVSGIAGISNKMSDRHARKYKPQKHHALLAINSANTLCSFLISSFEYQKLISRKKDNYAETIG
ncbi:TPA: abortive infection family protein [Legionella pneumophila]|nr:abortive infection family protein [Legionella pneumophila]HAT1659743.1 abortive infection family protein [Legionella pneumophila]HAT1884103.1 abortive infection family protein [Legionella pneumophila]HAT2115693.1 abortive infection family protein [Legionella pneumophila]HAT8720787.1 hypothetical protein [Legionella pneumophila]HAU1654462.1 abortive infection family protein [Legionella pneumophila]